MKKTKYNNCLNCEEELFGRIDKKFCDSYCKSQYHNERSLKNSSIVKEVNKSILNLYKYFLKQLGNQAEVEISSLALREISSSLKWMTHIDTCKQSNHKYICIYDLCLIRLENGNYKIIRNHETIKLF